MTLFLRDKTNRTILDIDIFKNENDDVDLSSTVVIKPYSEFLIENIENDLQIIRDFDRLQKLRGWLWERYKVRNPEPTKMEVVDELREILRKVVDSYNLYYTED